jgi:chemotaxis protein methyltransferase CheR
VAVQICDPDFQFIRQLVYDQSSIHLGDEKREMVCTRLNNRLSEYCALLKSNREPGEITHLIDALSTNFTTFFREIEHFKFLKDTIIPNYLASGYCRSNEPLRMWSAACSTGEEPYSAAIVFDSCMLPPFRDMWHIFASDISTRVLEKARQGIYEERRVELPNPAWLPRYFQKGQREWEGHFRVKQPIRERIDFEHMNLLQPGPEHADAKYYVIFCRNVMIYFDRETSRALVDQLYRHLHAGGYLIIGHAESLHRKPRGLHQIKTSIFRKTLR